MLQLLSTSLLVSSCDNHICNMAKTDPKPPSGGPHGRYGTRQTLQGGVISQSKCNFDQASSEVITATPQAFKIPTDSI
jgi:hypothetical protein